MNGFQLAQMKKIMDLQSLTEAATAQNTNRQYAKIWNDYQNWAVTEKVDPKKPPEGNFSLLVALYVRHLVFDRSLKPSSVEKYLAAVKFGYKKNGVKIDLDTEIFKNILDGVRRMSGAPVQQAEPIKVQQLQEIVDTIPEDMAGWRDKALLLIGFSGAFRRSELVGIDVGHITKEDEGIKIFLPRSKTDQEGAGRWLEIPYMDEVEYCPVRALNKWLARSGIEKGPVFRSFSLKGEVGGRLTGRSVARIIQKRAKEIGLTGVSGHSLRAGYVTSAVDSGVTSDIIIRQTGHSSVDMLKCYDRFTNTYRESGLRKIYKRLRRI